MVIPRNLNSNFGFQIFPVTGRDILAPENPDPTRIFSIGNQNLDMHKLGVNFSLCKCKQKKFNN
jgi:hypothetical protein